ncbi:MAG: Type III restriction-modification system methylation subunit, partial [uncultured Chloroflexia bacterium]
MIGSMSLTDYQAKYFAYELTRQAPSDSVDKLAAAVAGAQVDLNPHQVDAALFAFRSPLSKGALLADEVGLGKTIEAGLVLSQHWAELKRHLLIIVPASLRKQWHQELSEKFFLPCRILERKSFDAAVDQAIWNPFEDDASIVICSIEFARNKASAIATVPWDLIVIDEAHRLRNVWRSDNKIAKAISQATRRHNKLLLTATPLQNSLLELYGLLSIIDEHAFGNIESFREQYMTTVGAGAKAALRSRLQPMVTRTLRRQVEGYISYTKRRSIVEWFTPDDQEDVLYDLVSEYLRRPNLQALPKSQRSLITITLRKLLASSTFAIAGALTTMSDRLKKTLEHEEIAIDLKDALEEDVESLDTESDEFAEDDPAEPTQQEQDIAAIRSEIEELEAFKDMALGITSNAKGRALLRVLKVAMDQVAENKAPRK